MCCSLTNILGSACSNIFGNLISNICDKCSLNGSLLSCCSGGHIFCCSQVVVNCENESDPLITTVERVDRQKNRINRVVQRENSQESIKLTTHDNSKHVDPSNLNVEKSEHVGIVLWSVLRKNKFNLNALKSSGRFPNELLNFLTVNLRMEKLEDKNFFDLDVDTQVILIEAAKYSSNEFRTACLIQHMLAERNHSADVFPVGMSQKTPKYFSCAEGESFKV